MAALRIKIFSQLAGHVANLISECEKESEIPRYGDPPRGDGRHG